MGWGDGQFPEEYGAQFVFGTVGVGVDATAGAAVCADEGVASDGVADSRGAGDATG